MTLHILAQPTNSVSIALPHNHTAHEHLDRPNALKRHLAFAGRLVQAQFVAQLVFGYRVWVVDLIAQDHEGGGCKVFHGEEGVELSLGFMEALVVFCVDEEDDSGDFGD